MADIACALYGAWSWILIAILGAIIWLIVIKRFL